MNRWTNIAALAALLVACGSDASDNGQSAAPDTGVDTAAEDTATSEDSGVEDAAGSGEDAGTDAAPDTEPAVVEPDDRPDGEACVDDIQCESGLCLTDEDGFPGGYCTVADCESRRDCYGVDRACLRGEFNGNLCVELCETVEDCREGYDCVGTGTGNYCYPSFANDVLEPTCEMDFLAADDVPRFTFGGGAMDRRAVTFEIGDDTQSFALVTWDRQYAVQPVVLELPDGQRLALEEYAQYLYTPLELENVAPLLFPGGPQFTDLVMPGTYTLEVGYDGPEDTSPCLVVLEDDEDLDATDELVVDLNFYFVGVPGLNARVAETDAGFAAMIAEFEQVMGLARIRVGEVRYIDVEGDVEDEFAIIRDQEASFELVELTRQPGSTRDALLSTNVFFIQGFAGGMDGVLGISTGIPGVPGIHGQQGTGLVFSSQYLGPGGGDELVGQVLAHELGHFLGLFHTTEQFGGGVDHLADTPECAGISRDTLPECPDFDNLMFPIAAPRTDLILSEGQTTILRANPLTKFPE